MYLYIYTHTHTHTLGIFWTGKVGQALTIVDCMTSVFG